MNVQLIGKTVDQTNTTDVLVEDDELRFTVVAGHRYTVRIALVATADNDDGRLRATFGTEVNNFRWGALLSSDSGVEVTLASGELEIQELIGTQMRFINGTVNAVDGGGEIVFQFRNPDGNVAGDVTVKAGSFIELFDLTAATVVPPPPFSGSGYPNARALIASIIEGVSITEPVTVAIAKVYQFRPDGGAGLQDFPNVMITGYQMRYQRAAGTRERTYTIMLRLAARPVEGSAVAIQDVLDALKEAISAAFDAHVKLGQPQYHVFEGPNWITNEPQADGATMWEDGEILLTIKEAATFAA